MKKLILGICMICTAGVAEAGSKRDHHHSKQSGLVVQTTINTSLGVLPSRSGSNLINIVFVNNPATKVYRAPNRVIVPVTYIKRHKIVHKKTHHKSHNHHKKAHKHHSKVKYKSYHYR